MLDDLEHVIFGQTAFWFSDEGMSDATTQQNVKTYTEIEDILSHTFTKKYNLLYQNDSLTHACDFTETKKTNTDVIVKILSQNEDKMFLVIDHGRFDAFSLKKYPNCQVWPRKYFAPFSHLTHPGSREESIIQKKRENWFCFIGGRSEVFRTQMFNWIIGEGLDKSNKVTYLSYGVNTRDIDLHNDQRENFIATGGKIEYKEMIPFNNFETKENIPASSESRLGKCMSLYDCLFNIVVETFTTNQSAFHTEKTLNSILYGHIPIIIGGEGSMKKLQDMGIIIPDYIQWPIWDDLEVAQLHMNKNHIIQRQLIDLFTTHKIEDISTDWYPYAIRNLNKLNNLKENCAMEEKEICRWILTATHSISNPKYQRLYQ